MKHVPNFEEFIKESKRMDKNTTIKWLSPYFDDIKIDDKFYIITHKKEDYKIPVYIVNNMMANLQHRDSLIKEITDRMEKI